MFGAGSGSLNKVWEHIHAERRDLAIKELHVVKSNIFQFYKNCDLLKNESKKLNDMVNTMESSLKNNLARNVLSTEYGQAEKILDTMRKLTKLLLKEEQQEK